MQDNTKENQYEEQNDNVFTFDEEEPGESKLTGGSFTFKEEEPEVKAPAEEANQYVDVDEFLSQLSTKSGNGSEDGESVDLNARFLEQSAMLQSSLRESGQTEAPVDDNDDDTPYCEEEDEDEFYREEQEEAFDEEEELPEDPGPIKSNVEAENSDSFWEDEDSETNVDESGVGSKNEKLKKLQASASNDDSIWNRSKDAMNKVFATDNIEKKRQILGLDFKFWKIFILLFFTVDTILYNFAVYKIAYPLIESVSKSLGIEALQQASYEKYYVIFSYVIAFFVGGTVLMFIMKLARKLLDGVGTHESVLLVRIITAVVLLVFLVGGIVLGISKGFLTTETYRWFAPMLAYLGGILGDFWF